MMSKPPSAPRYIDIKLTQMEFAAKPCTSLITLRHFETVDGYPQTTMPTLVLLKVVAKDSQVAIQNNAEIHCSLVRYFESFRIVVLVNLRL